MVDPHAQPKVDDYQPEVVSTDGSTTYLLVAHGTDGDVLPVIRVARELRQRGHRVALLTHARYGRRVRDTGVRFVAVDTVAADATGQADDAADLNRLGERPDLDAVRDYYERHGFLAQLRFECRALGRLHRPGRTLLVGLTLSSVSVLTAAEALGTPAVCLSASPFHLSVSGKAAGEYAYVFGPGVDTVRGELGLPPVGDWAHWLSTPTARIGTWPQWFDEAGVQAPEDVRLTGFILGDELSEATPGPLPDTRDTVLVAGSSGNLTDGAFYRSAIGATALLNRLALVVTRDRDLLPEELPAHVRWYPRLPFRDLVPRVTAVVHHGGIGTATRALAAGVPQVILASGFDRPDNGARLAQAGLAEWLPASADLPPELVAERLAAALARGQVAVPRPVDSVPAAADALEELAKETLSG